MPGSRPKKWERWTSREGLTLLEGWARLGLSAEQIAANIGISRSSLYNWCTRFPALEEALRKGKETVDFEVENALLQRALGFNYTETRTEETERGAKTVTTEKYALPDISAQKFWLQNRRPDLWRERSPEPEEDEEGGEAGVILLGEVEEEAED